MTSISQTAIDVAERQAIRVIVAMKKTGFHPYVVQSHQTLLDRATDILRLILLDHGIPDIEPMRDEVQAAARAVVFWIESSNQMLPVPLRATFAG